VESRIPDTGRLQERLSPLQYMAGMVAPLWLTVVSVALLASAARVRD